MVLEISCTSKMAHIIIICNGGYFTPRGPSFYNPLCAGGVVSAYIVKRMGIANLMRVLAAFYQYSMKSLIFEET